MSRRDNPVIANHQETHEPLSIVGQQVSRKPVFGQEKPNFTFSDHVQRSSNHQDISQQQVVDKSEIMNVLGISEEFRQKQDKLDLKFMSQQTNNNINSVSEQLFNDISKKIDKIHYKRETNHSDIIQNIQMKNSSVKSGYEDLLYENVERVQKANHVTSNLENETLDNIEAQLEAHRFKMQALRDQYLNQKNSGQMIPPPPKQKPQSAKPKQFQQTSNDNLFDSFQKDDNKVTERKTNTVLTEMKQMNQTIKDRDRQGSNKPKKNVSITPQSSDTNLLKPTQDDDSGTLKITIKNGVNTFSPDSSGRKSPKTVKQSSKNPYVQYEKKYNNFKKEKKKSLEKKLKEPCQVGPIFETKNHEKIHDFDRYKIKSTVADEIPVKKSKSPKKRSTSVKKNISSTELPTAEKLAQKKPKKVDRSVIEKDELEMLKYFFSQIEKDKPDVAPKIEVAKFLIDNPRILELYEFSENYVNSDLMNYKTENKQEVNLEEFVNFLKQKQTQKERYQNQDKQTSTFLLNQEHVDLFKEIFEVMDRNNDLILPRQAFIKRLRSDPRVAKILQLPAVYLPSIDKTLPLERVFQQIIQDMYQGDADHEKSAAFISWNQFIGGFNKHKGPDEKIKLMKVKLDFNNRSDDQDKVVLDLNTIKMFEEVYATLNQEDGYVKVIDFLEAIRAHDSYREVSIQLGRTKAEKYDLQKEQVQEVLNRIEWEADEYIDLEEFMDFFSKRGRPKHFMQKEEKQRLQRTIMNKAPATEKLEKQFEKQIEINNESQEIQIDGYDSDPEYRNQKMQFMKKSNSNSKLGSPKGQEILKHLLSPKSPKNTLPRSKSAYQVGDQMSYKDYAQRQRQSSREQLGYTIPEPFRFDSRERSRPKSIRERKVEEMVQQYNQKKYSKSSFQANEVPKSVKMPLYKELTRQQEERRKENKQNSIAMTLQNERPFSFYERDQYKKVQKKTKSERDNYQFKAKSVPWYCSVQLFDNMKQQEEIQRRERVASYAQLSLTMSKLPPRMEKYELIKKSIKIKEGSKQKVEEKTMKSFQSKSIPNFAKLQETFQKLMDKKKDSQKMTTFVPFNFTAPRPKPSQFDHDQVYKQPTDFKLKQKQLEKLKQPPTIQPSTTKKQEAQIEHRRQQEEEKRQKLQQKEKEDQERIEKQNKFKSRVQRSEFLIDNSRALEEKKQQKLKNFKDERQQNEKNWSQTLEQINKNLESRPLLFEQVDNNRNNEINQIRKVLTFVKVLKSSGVKDIKKMLTPDEKDLYDKFNILSKHGFAKEFADLVEQPQKKKPKSPQKNKSQLVQA